MRFPGGSQACCAAAGVGIASVSRPRAGQERARQVWRTSSASALRGFPDGPSILVTQRAQETGAPDGL